MEILAFHDIITLYKKTAQDHGIFAAILSCFIILH